MRNIVSPLDGFASPFGPRTANAALPQDGLVADWRFSEGSGSTVADETGSYNIDLTEAPTPNTSWEAFGLSANSGAIETPVITNVRTVCMFYRVEKNGTGFHQSGPVATNAGPLGAGINTLAENGAHIGQGFGVGLVAARADTGGGANWLVTGGWRVAFFEYTAATTGFLTFGSRGNSTNNRFTEFEIAWAGVYNKTLNDDERLEVYNWCRSVARDRSINLDFRDMATKADAIILWGQSNADGRAAIADLSPGDQARTYDDVSIIQCDFGAGSTESFELLNLGVNHNDQSSSLFGAEVPWANLREDNPTGRDLYVIKAAVGSSYLAPTSDPNVSLSWSSGELETSQGFYQGLLRLTHQAIGDALQSGVSLDVKAFVAYQGEQDALQSSTADVWEDEFGSLIESFELHTAITLPKIYVTRIYDSSPSDATAYATVRAAQASVVSTLGARASLVDVDGYSFGDAVHLDADGMTDYAEYIWNDLSL